MGVAVLEGVPGIHTFSALQGNTRLCGWEKVCNCLELPSLRLPKDTPCNYTEALSTSAEVDNTHRHEPGKRCNAQVNNDRHRAVGSVNCTDHSG